MISGRIHIHYPSIKGSMAGTALKTSLANMAAPTDSMAAAMDKYGISYLLIQELYRYPPSEALPLDKG